MKACEHESAGVLVIELAEIEVCADCGIEIDGLAKGDLEDKEEE